jgi:hypothetical protein
MRLTFMSRAIKMLDSFTRKLFFFTILALEATFTRDSFDRPISRLRKL